MAEQNPWKKQMLANKMQTNNTTSVNNTSPISKFPSTQQQTTPPWIKKKQQISPNVNTNNAFNQSTTNNNQPSWMKSNTNQNQQNNNQSPNVPPWMKNKQQTSNTSPSQPSWMKNKQQGSTQSPTQPAWMKNNQANSNNTNNQPNQSTNQPSWMQNRSTVGSPGQINQSNVFGADKKKKQQQQRLRKQKQQKQRLQRQEEQRKMLQKLKQQQNESINTHQMQQQDRISKERQKADKVYEQQKKRLALLQQQKNKKNKKNTKSQKKLSQFHRIPPSLTAPYYHQFLYYYTDSLNSQLQYKQKLQNQKMLTKICKNFSNQMQQKIRQIVSNQEGQRNILSPTKKNKIINLQEINTQVYYAFCQGQQKQMTSTPRSALENQSDSNEQNSNIKFDMSSIQRLQRIFAFYNNLNNILCSISKKLPSSSITKFRIPLFTFLNYKGIAFLCQSYSEQILEAQAVLPSQYKQIFNEFVLIQKQLKQKYHYHLNKSDLMVKKIFVQAFQQQVYVFCLKNWDIKPKHILAQDRIPLQQLTTDYYLLSQIHSRKIPLISPSEFQTFKKVKTSAFSQLADIVHLAQSIFIVYSSCQGQVQEKQFWQLILSENQQIWNLIRCAGYKQKLHKQKRILFLYFEGYSGVSFVFENKTKSKGQKLLLKEINFKAQNYQFSRLQLNEIIKNFPKYLKENKFQLAEHSLELSKNVQDSQISKSSQINDAIECSNTNIQNNLPGININYAQKYVQYQISKNQFHKALKQLYKIDAQIQKRHQTTNNINKNNFLSFSVKIQLLALNIKLKNESEILKNFKQILQIINFYYGEQTLANSILYQMLGGYYSLKRQKNEAQNENKNSLQENVITLYQHSLTITIKFYGDQSEAIAEVYLSRAIAFLNLKKFELFYKDIEHAIKIFKSHSKQGDKVAQCMYYKGTAKILQNINEKRLQGIELIQQSSLVYLKLSHYSKAIQGFLLIVERLDTKLQSNLQRIQKTCQKVVGILMNYFQHHFIWKRAINLTLQKLDPELKALILEADNEVIQKQRVNQQLQQTQNQQSPIQVIKKLQQTIKGFTSFIEMIKWLGWTAFSLGKSQTQLKSSNKTKFDEIIKILKQIMNFKLSSDIGSQQDQQQSNTKYMIQNSQQLQIKEGQESSSPIKKYTISQTDRNQTNQNKEQDF